jgi:hypothetical protein
VRRITRHHLVPRSRTRRRRRKRRNYDPADFERVVELCSPCHRNVHASIENRELERDYRTLEALAIHPDVRKFTEWVRSKPHGTD